MVKIYRNGAPEALIGFLLIAAIGFSGVRQAIEPVFQPGKPLWHGSGKLLLFYGLSIPLLVAGLSGAGPGLILRDLLPFAFFLLPVFMLQNLEKRPLAAPYLLVAVSGLGVVFALRSFLHIYPFNLISPALFRAPDELFYFANAPSVLFAGLILTGLAGEKLMNANRGRDIILAAAFFGLALIPLLAMALSEQRATLGALALYGALLMLAAFWLKTAKSLRILTVTAIFLWVSFPVLSDVWHVLSHKTVAVGLNMRLQEAGAVWQEVSSSPGSLLFGLGWGGTFHSPAVGGLSVNFTHSLLTSMLLKTGLTGLMLSVFYLAGLSGALVRLVFRNPVSGFALAAPFLIDIFFYASFKSLDFGLVLLLIPAFLFYFRESARKSSGQVEKKPG